MFGSFLENFGLNAFPWDSLDAQGGLFGQNAPQTPLIGSQPSGTAPAHGPTPTMPLPTGGGPAPQGGPPGSPASSPMSPGGGSPLANPAQPGGPGAPNSPQTQAQPQPTAPAAGVGSPFGAPLA